MSIFLEQATLRFWKMILFLEANGHLFQIQLGQLCVADIFPLIRLRQWLRSRRFIVLLSWQKLIVDIIVSADDNPSRRFSASRRSISVHHDYISITKVSLPLLQQIWPTTTFPTFVNFCKANNRHESYDKFVKKYLGHLHIQTNLSSMLFYYYKRVPFFSFLLKIINE